MTQEAEGPFPVLRQVVLDTTDARQLAEFYRQLLGYSYRAGDEPPTEGDADEKAMDWLVLCAPDAVNRIAFQPVTRLVALTWPRDEVPQQFHLDLTVPTVKDLYIQHAARSRPRRPAAPGQVRRRGGTVAGLRRPGGTPLLHFCGALLRAVMGSGQRDLDRPEVHAGGHSTCATRPPWTSMLTKGEHGSPFSRSS